MSCLLAGAHLVAYGLHRRRHRCLVRPVRILHSATPEPSLHAYSIVSERKKLFYQNTRIALPGAPVLCALAERSYRVTSAVAGSPSGSDDWRFWLVLGL